MENLIPLINELQSVFTAVGSSPIDLPQLVVVGSQSSGKSSVLEHIVGRDFLPRGTGIVTRRPLILQLKHEPLEGANEDEEGFSDEAVASSSSASTKLASKSSEGLEWGEFLHLPGRKFFDFNEIREEISRETDRVVGGGKGISHQPLQLAIHSPNVLTLTLVDLPGVTRVPVADQPADIEAQINAMIMQYISSPHSVIIAVSAANSDIANSDSLKLAREVDPAGIRTLGVLTKLDLMDRGTDAMTILNNSAGVELQHGFVGVVCRGQEAIKNNLPIRDALVSERTFFATHPVYRSIANRLGTPFLARKLNSILMLQIQSSLPEIRNKIQATISETQLELESYGSKSSFNDSAEKGSVLLPLISKYCEHLSDALEGRSPDLSTSELYGGARISYIFHEMFGEVLANISPLDLLSDHDIRISIRNASGPRPALFIPEVCFELLVKKQIERLLNPSLDCVELVFHELQRVSLQCEALSPELTRFPNLKQKLLQSFQVLLRSCLDPTKNHIESLIQCELSFINTRHSDFIGGSAAVAQIMQKLKKVENHNHAGNGATVDGKKKELATVAEVKDDNSWKDSNSSPSKPAYSSTSVSHGRSSTATTVSAPGGSGFFSSFFRPAPAPVTSNGNNGAANHRSPGDRRNRAKTVGANEGSFESDMYTASTSAASGSTASSTMNGNAVSSSVGVVGWHLPSMEASERDVIETEVIKVLMKSYFDIVRKTVLDQVPKSIMCFLVSRIKREIQAVLVRELYQPQLLDSLLEEAEDIAERREACKELLQILQRAMDILNTARDWATNLNA